MPTEKKTCRFFMSANTPGGFVTNFNELTDFERFKRSYLIKGTPGSGKSTMLYKAYMNTDESKELIHCSADIASLDAVIFHGKRITVLDATAPHSIEPIYPSAFERVISLYDFCNTENAVKNLGETERLYELENVYTMRAQSFLRAAGMLISNNESLAARCVNLQKLESFASRLCLREFKGLEMKNGEERVRYLSALAPDGIFMFTDTALALCERIYIIDDDNGAVAELILNIIRKNALMHGQTVYRCLCPLSMHKKTEHLFLPDLSLGFMTSNKFHPVYFENARRINTARFYDGEKYSAYRAKTSFQKRAAKELLAEASGFMAEKNKIHKQREKLYLSDYDFKGQDEYVKKFLDEIKGM